MPREVKPFVQCHIKMQPKPRTDQFLRSSEAQTPHLNSLTALPSHHSHSHLIGGTLSPKASRQRHSKWFTPPHLPVHTAAYYLPWYAGLSQASVLHSHQSCPLCTHAGSCWFFALIPWTHHNFVNTVQSSRASTAWQLRPSHGLLWIAHPKSHCGTVPGASIASTRVQPHTSHLNPTWIWEGLHLGWTSQSFGLREHVKTGRSHMLDRLTRSSQTDLFPLRPQTDCKLLRSQLSSAIFRARCPDFPQETHANLQQEVNKRTNLCRITRLWQPCMWTSDTSTISFNEHFSALTDTRKAPSTEWAAPQPEPGSRQAQPQASNTAPQLAFAPN